MIQADRLESLFLELVQIDSLSRREGRIADRLAHELRELGASVVFDQAGAAVGGEVGNLIAHGCRERSTRARSCCARTWTRSSPASASSPVVEGDVIRSDGTNVLGGDDKSGIAIVLRVPCAWYASAGSAHPPIDVVFTICEELGLLGAHHLDVAQLARPARPGLRQRRRRAACSRERRARSASRPSSAGARRMPAWRPERGVSAIRVASEAIAAMRLGRIDPETTANLGVIHGGRAVNIVPDEVRIRGEARSHDLARLAAQSAHMRACFEEAAARHPGRAASR